VFGRSSVANAAYAGIGLDLLDAQGYSYAQLMQLALEASLGAKPANAQVVDLLFGNVEGRAPSNEERSSFVRLLDTGAHSAVSMAVMLADTDLNKANIDLTGLARNGLVYTKPAPRPSVNLTADAPSFKEGEVATFSVTTSNVASGTSYAYTIGGAVLAADIVGGQLSGTVVIAADGTAKIRIPLAADTLLEASETLTVTLQGASASIAVVDVDLSPPKFVSASPEDGATGTDLSTVFRLVFNEPIRLGSVPITVAMGTDPGG
jgi:hypothetical protein